MTNTMSVTPLLRATRAAVFAAMCVVLAAFGHALAAHAALAATTVGQAWCAVFAASCLAAGRERGFAPIAVFMLGAQALLHDWFHAAQLQPTGTPCVSAVDLPAGVNVPQLCGPLMPGWAASALMVGVYVLAALLCAWWLARGEAALFALGRQAFALCRVLLAAPLLLAVVTTPRSPRRALRPPVARTPVILISRVCPALVRRGPPSAVVFI